MLAGNHDDVLFILTQPGEYKITFDETGRNINISYINKILQGTIKFNQQLSFLFIITLVISYINVRLNY